MKTDYNLTDSYNVTAGIDVPETTTTMHLPVEEQDALLSDCRKGDSEAYDVLAAHYRPHALRHAKRVLGTYAADAEDITQDALLSVWTNIHNVQGYFWMYLQRAIVTKALNHIRNIRNRKTDVTDFADPESPVSNLHAETASPEETALANERVDILHRAIDRLSPRYRKVIVMKELEECSYDDIVSEFGLNTRGRAKSLCNTARLALRNAFLDLSGELTDADITGDVDDDDDETAPIGETLSLFG